MTSANEPATSASVRGHTWPATRFLAAAWTLTAVLSLAGIALAVPVWSHLARGDAASALGGPLAGAWFASLGALIVRRARNRTAYFCVLEALQNVAKYARASQATVILACPDGHLEVTVADDGAGFDPAVTARGTGLQGMADRLAAAGGTLGVTSRLGEGTVIFARLPAHHP